MEPNPLKHSPLKPGTKADSNKPLAEGDEFWIASRNVTLIGAVLDAVLGLSKIAVGSVAHSYGLIADGIHSLTDLASDFLVLIITRFSRSSPDSDHPYGHARFETLATVVLGGMLLAVAVALAYETAVRFMRAEELPIPTWPALIIALISIGSKEWIYRYTARVAKNYKSDLLLANAWHSRSDAFSSLVVFVGIVGSMLGLAWMDLVAALAVAIIIGKIALNFIWDNVRQLVDTGLPKAELNKIRQLALDVEGVLDVHDLRSRRMGSEAFIEIHIQVDAWLSVSEGHFIGNCVSEKIKKTLPDIIDIVFHIDTEHEENDSSSKLPSRSEIISLLCAGVPGLADKADLKRTRLHYIDNKVTIEIFLTTSDSSFQSLARDYASTLANETPWLLDIRFWI